MSEKDYVTYGGCCGSTCGKVGGIEGITGCRFTLAPMCDNYVDIILEAVKKVDTSKVYAVTDKISTLYRGKKCHTLDALKACFIHAYKPDVHMTMEAIFSRGCPGDTEGESFLSANDVLQNESEIKDMHFNMLSKICLYPMGIEDYMPHIAHVVNKAIDLNLYDKSAHYTTMLAGDVQEVFNYFSYVLDYCNENLGHYVFQITLSVNSPTK